MGGVNLDCVRETGALSTAGHGPCYGVDRSGERACSVREEHVYRGWEVKDTDLSAERTWFAPDCVAKNDLPTLSTHGMELGGCCSLSL